MTMTQTSLAAPLRPAFDHATAMRLAAREYDRFADAVSSLALDDWTLPTDCPDWDVRRLVCHTVGMATMASSPWQTVRQQAKAARRARATGVDPLTALTAVQVAERDHWSPAQAVTEVRRIGPRATRGRRRVPAVVLARTLPQVQHVDGVAETWSFGYLIDVILTRDPWMHRLDLARATGQELTLTAHHDGVIVADVALEWARRHGQPYRLELTGPAGGRWSSGTGGEEIVMDAADFCRVVGGRPTPSGDAPSGLLATQVPF